MRILKISALLFFVTFTSLFSQEKKYQGLLWEVSGNGLKKSSYLYGSMHVSDKVSYHLSDAFFTRLLAADIVANESEPSTWIDLMGVMGSRNSYRNSNKLYARFYMEPAAKENLYPLFRTGNFTINNLLFRTDETQKEYQEETYLDMFIYRTGRKYQKKTVGLEDTKTSLLNVMNIDYRAMKPREENIAALQKIIKNTSYQEALMNYYRDKDLDMLDSLTSLASSGTYLKTLLYDRNVVMVHSIDSLVKTGSLFAAVGAAHLPGKNGIIEMLRAKGYNVQPVKDSYTNAGKAKKEMIEAFFIKPGFTKYTTADGVISLPLFSNAVIENQQNIQSPDLANGGYINVKRLLLKDFLNKNNRAFDHRTLDSLFYENIPGKITDKKQYAQDGYYVYDIKNITKTGNLQRYRYYVSPLEVIAVSMAGEKNYVSRFENEVFNNISVKPVTTAYNTFLPAKGGFNVQMPAYRVVYGEDKKAKTVQDAAVYAYDPAGKSAYFVLENTLTENENLEDTNFEMKRIQYEFYKQLDIDSTQTKLLSNPAAFTSESKIGSKKIQLKSVIKGVKYYLLGTVGATDSDANKFFASFTFAPANENTEYRTFTDTVAHYSIAIPKAANEKLDFERNNEFSERFYDDEEKVNNFKDTYGTRQFTLPSGQQADVFHHNYHRYHSIVSVDSLWNDFKKYITEEDDSDAGHSYSDDAVTTVVDADDYEDNSGSGSLLWDKLLNKKSRKIKIVNEKKGNDNGIESYEGMAVADNSIQAIKFKAMYKDGISYMVSTLVDKDYKGESPAIEKLFTSFKIQDNPKAVRLPDNRLQLFIEDARSEHDSIRYSALQSIHQLKITKNDRIALQDFISSFDFTAEETNALTDLYTKLGGLKDPAVIPFFEQQYKREGSNTIIQFAVLEALTTFKSDAAYKKIKELLEYDLPVSDSNYEVAGLFRDFGLDTEHSALLFPDILQYYSVPEYHEPIVDFTARLLEKDAIKPNKLKSYKKMLLTNTRLEIKRTKSRKANAETGQEDYTRSRMYGNEYLINYMELLYPFKSDREVAKVFETIKALDQADTNLELATLDIKRGSANDEEIKKLLADPKTLFNIQKLLTEINETGILKDVTDEQLATSALITVTNIDAKKEMVTFLEKRTAQLHGNTVSFYFYKIVRKSEGNYDSFNRERLAAMAFINKGDRIMPAAYKSVGNRWLLGNENIEKYKNEMIDATVNAGNYRATFGKGSDDYEEGLPDID
ncbi:hypothetical protein Q765_13285 [Flavobacterium rivuli WB 3.3-2 = DSM 21788]|uniref:TraB/GumN family protein n=1 Tax=Flavobacterium rivuli WB 3.3-2 = DSM 21788 TaxID=1121895 RepID=A0A0A2M180_9FLAO|nr:TraB/GumN family protein [Flavobacterium rivuli]KGO86029.1 hypothetical protein Q765_13285 [Flavobacterium rivuli WB 3.3-2 = DSM 21788]